MNRKAKAVVINALVSLVAIAAGLGFSEIILRNFTGFPIHAPMGNRMYDDRLLYRMDTNLAGIDSAGFRNPKSYVSDRPDVAVVGDSFTYGYNVSRDASWPGRLEAALGQRVYNFGIGGYSLLQYVELVRMAAEAGYGTVIVGLLPENDMAICNAARLTYYNSMLSDEKGGGDPVADFCSLDAASQRKTARELFRDFNINGGAGAERGVLADSALASALRYAGDSLFNRRDNLARNRFFAHDSLTRATEECADPGKDFVFPISGEKDFIPEFHKNDLAYFSSFGAAGMATRKIFRRAVQRMKRDAAQYRTALKFFVIPGRRRIVSHALAEMEPDVAVPDWFSSLAASEEELVAMMRDELEALGLPVVDALPIAVASYARTVKQGRPHYPCFDGHPLEDGYQALADGAAELMR